MSHLENFVYAPSDLHEKHGDHFFNQVESFHNQHHVQSTDVQHRNILKELRKEFYSTDDAPTKSKPKFTNSPIPN